jgi:hypothetical protein
MSPRRNRTRPCPHRQLMMWQGRGLRVQARPVQDHQPPQSFLPQAGRGLLLVKILSPLRGGYMIYCRGRPVCLPFWGRTRRFAPTGCLALRWQGSTVSLARVKLLQDKPDGERIFLCRLHPVFLSRRPGRHGPDQAYRLLVAQFMKALCYRGTGD